MSILISKKLFTLMASLFLVVALHFRWSGDGTAMYYFNLLMGHMIVQQTT